MVSTAEDSSLRKDNTEPPVNRNGLGRELAVRNNSNYIDSEPRREPANASDRPSHEGTSHGDLMPGAGEGYNVRGEDDPLETGGNSDRIENRVGVRAEVKSLADESAELHQEVAKSIRDAYSCKHGNQCIMD